MDGPSHSTSHSGLAGPSYPQTATKLLGLHKLLPTIHPLLREDCQTHDGPPKGRESRNETPPGTTSTVGPNLIKVGQIRRFVVRAACKTRLAAGKEYLLMGRDGETRDSNDRPQYLLDKNSWIEELPDPRRCKATQYRNTCSHLESFTTSFGINGCRI
uniref:Netrin module non-TIMP type domain-containing protein n=1 Tax=Pseudonaja textilis TaxID=8673 RepID=A0A670Z8J5_PSETE